VPERAELAVTDGRPPPTDLPRGECIATMLDGGQIRVDHADPRILISAELLCGVEPYVSPHVSPHVSLDTVSDRTLIGALLRIRGVNRTVIYQITEYLPRVNGYIGQWPD
jgi:hypothetical protein